MQNISISAELSVRTDASLIHAFTDSYAVDFPFLFSSKAQASFMSRRIYAGKWETVRLLPFPDLCSTHTLPHPHTQEYILVDIHCDI